MRALITGFTTKSYTGYVGPGSRGIRDLTSVLPKVLDEIEVDFNHGQDLDNIENYDVVFIKVWDVLDEMYSIHVKDHVEELKAVDLSKVILISDHWNEKPAFNSMYKAGGFLKELAQLQHTNKVIRNLYRPQNENEIDPSIYCDVQTNSKFQSPRWIHGSLSFDKHSQFSPHLSYPVDHYSELTERELCNKIAKHGLVFANEYPSGNARWWRIRYYMAAMNSAAVLASERDQQAIYGFYVSPDIIERYREQVASLQAAALLDAIEPKSSIQRKVLNLLKKAGK
jgi:hypothetical protein